MERTIYADDAGVWATEGAGRRYGIEWDEVFAVSGYKLDGVTEFYTCVALDFEYGEFFEFDDANPGFADVVAAITQRLPGISEDWAVRLAQLSTDDPPLEVWKK